MKTMQESGPLIGCVADDFTGAGDVASFITNEGASCLLINGIPDKNQTLDPEYDAVVIALKSRISPVSEAVRDTEAAFDWLLANGVRTLYFKYCSTFDSTPQGNIGPVLDHLLERYNIPFTVLCPALPINQRTVRDGKLYVGNIPLDESPMRYHPLNPMWDSDVSVLMQAQSKYPCYKLTHDMYTMTDEEICAVIESWKAEHEHFYLVVDYYEEAHGKRIAQLFKGLRLLSGGSALPAYVYRLLAAQNTLPKKSTLILAGSCSQMTLKQIQYYLDTHKDALRILPEKLMSGEQTVDQIWEFIEDTHSESVLIYSSQTHEEIATGTRYTQQEISSALEALMAELGKRAVNAGMTRMIVAGGETSGAVMHALGETVYEIGPSVAPGIPILIPLNKKQMRLILKSGNFGQENFFIEALSLLEKEKKG